MEFAHPYFLLLLPLLALLLVPGLRRSLAEFTPAQRRTCLALRLTMLACVCVALAGPRVVLPVEKVAALFLVDRSASIGAAAAAAKSFVAESAKAKGGDDAIGVATFGATVEMRQALGETFSPREAVAGATAPRTDIAAALDFAAATLPADAVRRVVLLSDGQETTGDAAAAAQRLRAAGVELFAVPLRNAETPEVLVEKVEVPRRLKEGEPFDLTAQIRSNVATTAKVKLYQNQFLVAERAMELKPGVNEFRAPGLQGDGAFLTYEVEVAPALDTLAENNRAQAVATLRGQPRVLLVEGEEEKARPLAEALRREKFAVELRAASGLPKTLEDLQQFDLFVLSDVSAITIARVQMDLYRRWVQDFGGGFALLGGESSYGVGGYFRTPIETLLPVRMEHSDRQDLPSVAVLIVLDRSGSMTAQVQGVTKMSLANQGAALALGVLQPRDFFGVLAVDTRVHVIAPLGQHPSRAPVEQKILGITAGGGGIYIYTSLAESFQQLRDVPARIKHVILFSDSADAEEKSAGEMADGAKGGGSALDLASAMLAAKITTSVVALGAEQDKDTAFLRQLAERGNGRFYLTSDATSLPQIFSTETMKVAQSSLIEEPFQPIAPRAHPLLAGIDWAQAPLLLGYNATKPKPTADILLATERGEPLLAVWRYGLGQAAAFTSDAKARWAGEWLAWPGYGKFWAQLARGLMRKSDAASFAVEAVERGDRLEIAIDAVKPDGAFRNQLPLAISALDRESGETRAIASAQVAPGRYTASAALPAEGTTIFSISSPELPDGGLTFGHTRSYPREFLTSATNEKLLREIATHYDPKPEEIWTRATTPGRARRDLSDAFLIAALLLWPLDIFLRRRAWR